MLILRKSASAIGVRGCAQTYKPRMTIREGIYSAMEDELNRDPSVFLMGEEVARYHGAYKVS
jgi:hypothetical protein